MSKLITLDNLGTYNNELNKTILKKVKTFPEDAVDGDIYQYVGETTDDCINGHIYKKRIYDGFETVMYLCYEDPYGGYDYVRTSDNAAFWGKKGTTSVADLKSLEATITKIDDTTLEYIDEDDETCTAPRYVAGDIEGEKIPKSYNYWEDLDSYIQQVEDPIGKHTPIKNKIIQYTGVSNKNFEHGNFYEYIEKEFRYFKFGKQRDTTDSDIIWYKADSADARNSDGTLLGTLYRKTDDEFVELAYVSATMSSTGRIAVSYENGTTVYYTVKKVDDYGEIIYETEQSNVWKNISLTPRISGDIDNGIIVHSDGLYSPTNYLKQIDSMNYISSYFNDEKAIVQYIGHSWSSSALSLDYSGDDTNYGSIYPGQIARVKSYRTFSCYTTEQSNMIGNVIFISDITTNKNIFYIEEDNKLSNTGWPYDSVENGVLTVGSWTWKKNAAKNIKVPVWEILDLSNNVLKQVTSFPATTLFNLGSVYQYIGETNDKYIKNHIYVSKCDNAYVGLSSTGTNPSDVPRTLYALNTTKDNYETLVDRLYSKNTETEEYEKFTFPDTVLSTNVYMSSNMIYLEYTTEKYTYKYAQAGYDVSTAYWEDLYYASKVAPVTEWSDEPSDENIPSEKLVKNTLDSGRLVTTTWSELKALRDGKKLIPGIVYRITDYVCTTTQANTRAKNNLFDILVTALDKETLNEVASATYHEGDTYFTNESLPIWELKYCLDNDTTRFAWADAENGKGVIWYLKDEYSNECAYDFKNIQFLRDETFNTKYSVGVPNYYLTSADYYYYTFCIINSSNEAIDMSMVSTYHSSYNWDCSGNKVLGLDQNNENGKRYLTSNIFVGNVTGASNSKNVMFNIMDGYRNTLGGRNVYNNTFSINVYDNFFADEGYCYGNEFEHAYNNIFKGPCFSNRVSYTAFFGNIFDKKCASNTFNGWVHENTFKNIFSYNVIGGTSNNNIFNAESYRNNFGHNFIGNVIDCYTEDNTFGNNVRYVHFNGSNASKVYNYYIANGLQGTSTTKLEVTPVAGRTNEYTISRKTDGTLVDYCTADVGLECASNDDIDAMFN